ncbi:GyrI-like domain-containing protein [Agromyces sp. ISL-38]|uniref:GyrI-like domain-containing protein n=1 Tax=Agromyces sp. ISL-38 TaxID=2819107 RepID=UPI001BEAD74E|nr:GyrI-like domain-containing protein [Agromyces sp. ISL-38]MBT2499202.1 GyrI-like domain-containing protein [Agromyces sp. ISL-38]
MNDERRADVARVTDEKYDVKRAHRELYSPSAREFAMVDVPPMRYLAIDGHGDPNSAQDYADAVVALYSVAYAVKFRSKREFGRDFVVAPLEGLWRADDPDVFITRDKSAWSWTMLISQPDWISEEHVGEAIAANAKAPRPALDRLRLERIHEGTAVQILHLGSYDDETATLERLHDEWMPAHGLTFNGDHHEIYLSDPRRTSPEKLRTILRQPVRPAEVDTPDS